MKDASKVAKVKTSTNKLIEYKLQSNLAFQLLIKANKEGLGLDLRELLKYMLTPVPFSLATPDNFLAKTDKAKGNLILLLI